MGDGGGGPDATRPDPAAGLRVALRLGARTGALVLVNSARRRRQTRREQAARHPAGPGHGPGRLLDVGEGPDGTARFRFEHAALDVRFVASDVVSVDWGPADALPSYAVVDRPGRVPATGTPRRATPTGPAGTAGSGRPSVSGPDAEGWWAVAGEGLVVRVSAADGAVRYASPAGTVLRSEGPPIRRGTGWSLPFTIRPGERVAGLGEQAAPLDRRGGRYRLWNRDPGGSWGPGQDPLYMGIPVLLGTHAEGDVLVFHDNPTRAVVDLGSPDAGGDRASAATVDFAGGALRHFVAVGPVPHLLDRYTDLTGRPALPPRWALGYHQSRWGYRSEADVRAVSDGFAEAGIPLSAVHLDIDHMRGYRVFTVDRGRFPHLPRLAATLGRRGTRLVAIVDPGVKVERRFALYREGRRQRLFCTDPDGRPTVGVVWPGRAVFPDFTNPRTRAWWADQYRSLVDVGVAGFWHDMNEPTSIAVGSDPTLPTSTRHDFDGRGGDHGEGHNVYGLLMNRAGHDGVRRARPGSRPFILSRSGWAGTQRYAWNWTGDAETSWASLRQQVATVVGLGLSGVPFSGPDIGGFSGTPDAELYLRWLQLGVLLPFCRTHSMVGAAPREPWRFPEPARSAIADWIRFRYRLLPTLYTLAHRAAERGTPLARPLWWPAAGPVPGWVEADDAFLLGDDLLVAPVCTPGARHRTVLLPPGDWASLWGDAIEPVPGSRAVRLAAPLGRCPVLARRGAVLALDDGWAAPDGACRLEGETPDDMTAARRRALAEPLSPDHAPRRLAFHCWPAETGDGEGGAGDGGAVGSGDGDDRGAAGSAVGEVVDDAGDGDGPRRLHRVVVSGVVDGGTATCRWERSGDHPDPAAVRLVVHGWRAASATVDGRPVAVDGGTVDGPAFRELQLHGLSRVPPTPR